MIQRTTAYRAGCRSRVATQSTDAAFPMAFLALAFGVIAGVAVAGIVAPAMMRMVIPAVLRIISGS